jgi:DNA-binding CsgD family transcriptional regulator
MGDDGRQINPEQNLATGRSPTLPNGSDATPCGGRVGSDRKSLDVKRLAIKEFDKASFVRLSDEQWSLIARTLHLAGGVGGQEIMVLRGIAAGMTDGGIEKALGISHGTLRTYMDRLFHKCGARTRVGVLMKALEPTLKGKA